MLFAFGFVLISGCASSPPTPVSASPPPDVHVPAVSKADVLVLLAKANDVPVSVTQGEFEQIVQNSIGTIASYSASDWVDATKSEVDGCNNIDTPSPNPDEEKDCDNLGKDLSPATTPGSGISSNVDLTAAEIAFARACLAPLNNKSPAYGCLDFGLLYEHEGKPELALAVYQNAEKCRGPLVAEPDVREIDPDQQVDWSNSERKFCLEQEVAILYRMHSYDAERRVATILCNADSEIGCGYLKDLGADVNMQAVEQRQAELQAANRATAAADYAADAKASAEADANFSAEMQALHSLPGGSDPNAIVDTANEQAANMNALGAANDAALRQAAEQHREQAAAQQAQAEAQQLKAQVGSATTSDSNLNTTTTGVAPTVASSGSAGSTSSNGTTPSGAAAAQAGGGSGNSGSSQYAQAMSSSCVHTVVDSSMYGWVSLQNTCSQAETVTFVGKSGDGSVVGTTDLAPGKSENTGRSPREMAAVGGIWIYACPYGYIPINMAGQAVSTPVTQYTCKYRGY